MVLVFGSIHDITRIEFGEISQLEKSGTYSRHISFFGYKGRASKHLGEFEIMEITLFSENKEALENIEFLK